MTEATAPRPIPRPRLLRRSTIVGAVLVLAVIGIGVAVFVTGRHRVPEDALRVVPAATMIVLSASPGPVFDSEFVKAWSEVFGGETGLGAVEKACGTNPLRAFERVLVFAAPGGAPGRPAPGDITYLASGDMDRDALIACVRKVLEADGSALLRADIDDFPAVRGARGDSRALFYGSRAVIGGTEQEVRRVLRVLRGEARSLRDEGTLTEVEASVASGFDVVLLGVVPPHWGAFLKRLLEAKAPTELAAVSDVEKFAVGIALGDGVRARVVGSFASEAQAAAVTRALGTMLDRVKGSEALSVTVLAPVLTATSVKANGKLLTVNAAVAKGSVAAVLRLVRQAMAPALPPETAPTLGAPADAPAAPPAQVPSAPTE